MAAHVMSTTVVLLSHPQKTAPAEIEAFYSGLDKRCQQYQESQKPVWVLGKFICHLDDLLYYPGNSRLGDSFYCQLVTKLSINGYGNGKYWHGCTCPGWYRDLSRIGGLYFDTVGYIGNRRKNIRRNYPRYSGGIGCSSWTHKLDNCIEITFLD